MEKYNKDLKPQFEKMSAKELKQKFYERFQMRGVMDNLQAQLRNQLAQEMNKSTSVPSPESSHRDFANKTLLPLQVTNWFVYDHLIRQHYEYTLSTFMSETGLSPKQNLTLHDVLYLFGIKPESEKYKNIKETYFSHNNENFLFEFLKFCSGDKNTLIQDHKSTQTERTEENIIEREMPKFKPESTVESFYPAVNKEYLLLNTEASLNKGYAHELFGSEENIFKKDSIIKSNKEHNDQIKKLLEKEEQLNKELKDQRELHESKLLQMREQLLQELDIFHEFEKDIRYELHQRKASLVKHEEMVISKLNDLQKYKQDIESKAEIIEDKIQHKLNIFQEEQTQMLNKRLEELNVKEESYKKYEASLDNIKKENEETKIKLEESTSKIKELETNIRNIQKQYEMLNEQNVTVLDKLESFTSSTSDKNNFMIASKKEEATNSQLKNSHAEKPENFQDETEHDFHKHKIHEVKRGLKFSPDIYELNEAVWNQQKMRLERELQNARLLYEKVTLRTEQQQMDIDELHRIIHHLQAQQSQSQNLLDTLLKEKSKSPSVASVETKNNGQTLYRPFPPPMKFPMENLHIPKYAQYDRNELTDFISKVKRQIDSLQFETEVVEKKYADHIKAQWKAPFKRASPYKTFRSSDTKFYEPKIDLTKKNDSEISQPITINSPEIPVLDHDDYAMNFGRNPITSTTIKFNSTNAKQNKQDVENILDLSDNYKSAKRQLVYTEPISSLKQNYLEDRTETYPNKVQTNHPLHKDFDTIYPSVKNINRNENSVYSFPPLFQSHFGMPLENWNQDIKIQKQSEMYLNKTNVDNSLQRSRPSQSLLFNEDDPGAALKETERKSNSALSGGFFFNEERNVTKGKVNTPQAVTFQSSNLDNLQMQSKADEDNKNATVHKKQISNEPSKFSYRVPDKKIAADEVSLQPKKLITESDNINFGIHGSSEISDSTKTNFVSIENANKHKSLDSIREDLTYTKLQAKPLEQDGIQNKNDIVKDEKTQDMFKVPLLMTNFSKASSADKDVSGLQIANYEAESLPFSIQKDEHKDLKTKDDKHFKQVRIIETKMDDIPNKIEDLESPESFGIVNKEVIQSTRTINLDILTNKGSDEHGAATVENIPLELGNYSKSEAKADKLLAGENKTEEIQAKDDNEEMYALERKELGSNSLTVSSRHASQGIIESSSAEEEINELSDLHISAGSAGTSDDLKNESDW